MDPARPRSHAAARTVAPLLAGAVAAASGAMLAGWPHRPPLPGGAGAVAAVALVVVAVLLVFAPAVRPPSSGGAPGRPDAVRAREPVHVGAPIAREAAEAAR